MRVESADRKIQSNTQKRLKGVIVVSVSDTAIAPFHMTMSFDHLTIHTGDLVTPLKVRCL